MTLVDFITMFINTYMLGSKTDIPILIFEMILSHLSFTDFVRMRRINWHCHREATLAIVWGVRCGSIETPVDTEDDFVDERKFIKKCCRQYYIPDSRLVRRVGGRKDVQIADIYSHSSKQVVRQYIEAWIRTEINKNLLFRRISKEMHLIKYCGDKRIIRMCRKIYFKAGIDILDEISQQNPRAILKEIDMVSVIIRCLISFYGVRVSEEWETYFGELEYRDVDRFVYACMIMPYELKSKLMIKYPTHLGVKNVLGFLIKYEPELSGKN